MVPAPMLQPSPITASPRYVRWLALLPLPSTVFFSSTKFPTRACSASCAPGRSRANGPTERRRIVAAGHFGLLRLDRDRAAPGDDVGEIVLALRIAPSEPAKRREQEPRIREINAGVHLGDLPLLEGGVLLLHDPRYRPVGPTQDAAVPLGVAGPASEQRDIGALPGGNQPLQRLRAQQRDVGGEDEDVPTEPAQRLLGAEHGVPGPQLLGLQGEPDGGAGKLPAELFLHALRLVPDHHHYG